MLVHPSYITIAFNIGLVVLVLIFLTCAYRTSDKQTSESIYAERLVGVHKKLQQVNDNNFEAVKFIPAVLGNAAR